MISRSNRTKLKRRPNPCASFPENKIWSDNCEHVSRDIRNLLFLQYLLIHKIKILELKITNA